MSGLLDCKRRFGGKEGQWGYRRQYLSFLPPDGINGLAKKPAKHHEQGSYL
jgi:hypothetical protein